MSRRLYAIHRIVAAIAFAQLLIWASSGLVFALLPAERVRGALVERAHEVPISADAPVIAPGEAVRRALQRESGSGLRTVTKIELRATPAGVFYVARGEGGVVRLDAVSGSPAPVDAAEAEETARRDQPGRPRVASSELIERDAHVEYRGKALPAFRVVLDDGRGTAVYVDARTGDVTVRRTDAWRWFDFMFALHTMDYKARTSVNHPWLVAAALAGFFTVLSGAVLWGIRVARALRRRSAPRDVPRDAPRDA